MFPSNLVALQEKLKNIYRNTKIFETQQNKIYNVGNQIKNYQAFSQKNTTYHTEKNQSIEIDPEMVQITRHRLVDRTLEDITVFTYQETRGNIEHVKERYEQYKNFYQMIFPVLHGKTTMCEIKNMLEIINSGVDI